jgi:hypothetical protein
LKEARILKLGDRRKSKNFHYLLYFFALSTSNCISHLFYIGSDKVGIGKRA